MSLILLNELTKPLCSINDTRGLFSHIYFAEFCAIWTFKRRIAMARLVVASPKSKLPIPSTSTLGKSSFWTSALF